MIVLFGSAVLESIDGAMCETTTFAQSLSTSGLTEARVQMTDCGALSGFSRVVWVQPRWWPRDRWLSCRAVAFNGMEPVSLRWTADSLRVSSAVSEAEVLAASDRCYGWNVDLQLQR